jgi:hypothetical protein
MDSVLPRATAAHSCGRWAIRAHLGSDMNRVSRVAWPEVSFILSTRATVLSCVARMLSLQPAKSFSDFWPWIYFRSTVRSWPIKMGVELFPVGQTQMQSPDGSDINNYESSGFILKNNTYRHLFVEAEGVTLGWLLIS